MRDQDLPDELMLLLLLANGVVMASLAVGIILLNAG